MKRGFWFKKIAGFILIAIAALLLFGIVVMSLWNNVLTAVVPVHTVKFGQALGILILSKLLFGGFSGGGGGWRVRGRWSKDMREKWQTMTPDEKEKFKHEWRNRCNRWGTPSQEEQGAAAE